MQVHKEAEVDESAAEQMDANAGDSHATTLPPPLVTCLTRWHQPVRCV